MSSRIIKFSLLLVALSIFGLFGCQRSVGPIKFSNINQNNFDQPSSTVQIQPDQNDPADEPKPAPEPVILGPKEESVGLVSPIKEPEVLLPPVNQIVEKLDYPVPFSPQAPFAVWDALHEEACEEAVMIIVAKYFANEPLTPHLAEQAILNLVAWEEKNDYRVDLSAVEVFQILKDYFNLKAELITDVSIERIKKELNQGKLIIVPTAGRQLQNPYFQTPGPIYHMLVIRGYNKTEFITNDPGTKRGEGFVYKYSRLLGAIHDWNHQLAQDGMTDDEINAGQKVMIVVSD